MNNQVQNDYTEIDLLKIILVLWKKAWLIILAMIVAGGMFFSYAVFLVAPQYKATAMMYVNNSSFTVGSSSFSISSGELTAAKKLLDIYVIILKSRTTLEQVIETADLDYTYEQLSGIVKASSVNDTEVFSITATCSNPQDAKLIVDTIVEVLPDRIADIVDGSSVRLVDHAVLPVVKASPSYTRYATIGVLIGAVISCAIIILRELMDTAIKDEEYLRQTYEIPVLAVIPDVYDNKKSSYKKYYRSYSSYAAKGTNNE